MSRTGYYSIEKSFASEELVLHARHRLYLHPACRRHRCQMPCIHNDLLPCRQSILDYMTVKFTKENTVTAQALHHESFASEKSGTELLIEEH